ncbi:hypothetical protein G7Y89_g5494 [Cudoniella acicularis]|uniref:C2H2-type domain-containing protein n=1 Tax=Cudoniella acicularis TaxID=354080 RepID=A0A8H4RPI0_9HELO|nr:hypothetical protein G7Y89_g5494 [Cudoniella acicularis]
MSIVLAPRLQNDSGAYTRDPGYVHVAEYLNTCRFVIFRPGTGYSLGYLGSGKSHAEVVAVALRSLPYGFAPLDVSPQPHFNASRISTIMASSVFLCKSMAWHIECQPPFPVKNAPSTVESFLRDVDSFRQSMLDTQRLLDKIPTTASVDLDRLEYQIGEFSDHINRWLDLADAYDPESKLGSRAFFSRMRVAVNKNGFSEFHNQIARYQQELGISLAILGQSLSLQGLNQLDAITADLKAFQERQSTRDIEIQRTLQSHSESHATSYFISQTVSKQSGELTSYMDNSVTSPLAEQLNRVESSTRMSIAYSRHSSDKVKALSDAVSSLGSQVEQLQEIVRKSLSYRHEPEEINVEGQFEFSCGAILGIEDAFIENRCIYCEQNFSSLSDWEYRGMHLVEDHSFGDCDFSAGSIEWTKFRAHIIFEHGASSRCEERNLIRPKRRQRVHNNFQATTGDSELCEDCRLGNHASEGAVLDAEREAAIVQILEDITGSHEPEGIEHPVEESELSLLWHTHWKATCLVERVIISERNPMSMRNLIMMNSRINSKNWLDDRNGRLKKYLEFADRFGAFQLPSMSSLREQPYYDWMNPAVILYYLEQHFESKVPREQLQWNSLFDDDLELWNEMVGKANYANHGSARVNYWLLQTLIESETAKVIIARYIGITITQDTDGFQWLLENFTFWTVDNEPAPKMGGARSETGGAIDSRDNLASDHENRAGSKRHSFDLVSGDGTTYDSPFSKNSNLPRIIPSTRTAASSVSSQSIHTIENCFKITSTSGRESPTKQMWHSRNRSTGEIGIQAVKNTGPKGEKPKRNSTSSLPIKSLFELRIMRSRDSLLRKSPGIIHQSKTARPDSPYSPTFAKKANKSREHVPHHQRVHSRSRRASFTKPNPTPEPQQDNSKRTSVETQNSAQKGKESEPITASSSHQAIMIRPSEESKVDSDPVRLKMTIKPAAEEWREKWREQRDKLIPEALFLGDVNDRDARKVLGFLISTSQKMLEILDASEKSKDAV